LLTLRLLRVDVFLTEETGDHHDHPKELIPWDDFVFGSANGGP
jgi:hypothetical protein